jgi:hypothetical protein
MLVLEHVLEGFLFVGGFVKLFMIYIGGFQWKNTRGLVQYRKREKNS